MADTKKLSPKAAVLRIALEATANMEQAGRLAEEAEHAVTKMLAAQRPDLATMLLARALTTKAILLVAGEYCTQYAVGGVPLPVAAELMTSLFEDMPVYSEARIETNGKMD